MNAQPQYRVSNSEIQTFQKCRRKWWLSYVERWRKRDVAPTGPLALGSRVHGALEAHYKNNADLLEAYTKLADTDRMICLSVGSDLAAFDSEAELGRIMLEGYLDWVTEEGLDSIYDIIGVEEYLSAELLGGRILLQGKIDMRVRDKRDGSRLLRDFKTSAQTAQYTSWIHMNPQLMTYMVLDRLATEDEENRIAGGEFRMLKKVKRGPRATPPFYEQVDVRHNQFTMRAFWVRLHGVLTDMVAARDAINEGVDPNLVAYPSPSRDCLWGCPFVQVCPMFDDGSGAQQMLEDLYEKVDPYDYYGDTASSDEN